MCSFWKEFTNNLFMIIFLSFPVQHYLSPGHQRVDCTWQLWAYLLCILKAACVTWPFLTSPDLTWSKLTWPDLIFPHLTSLHLASLQSFTSSPFFHFTSLSLNSPASSYFHFMSLLFTSLCCTSSHPTWLCLLWMNHFRLISLHFASTSLHCVHFILS